MNEDQNSLAGLFSPLSVDTSGLDGTFSSATAPNFSPISVAGSNQSQSSASGANPTASINGFTNVLSSLTSMFSAGVAAYNSVASKTGLPLSDGSKTATAVPLATPAQQPVWMGLTQNQLYMAGAAVGLIAILFLMKRK